MRATFDFEAYEWVHGLCCGLYWQDLQEKQERFAFIHEDTKYSTGQASCFGDESDPLLPRVIASMANASLLYGITEWWAHNGGKYDALLLMEEALKANYRMIGIPAAGRLIRLDIYVPMRSKEVRVRLLDSYAVVQAGLKNALESFQVQTKKKFEDKDYARDVRLMPVDDLREGNYADCKGLYELLDIVEKQVTGFGGKLKSTFSSCAMSVVKAKLADKSIAIPSHEGHQDYNEISRKAYYGGRVEVFHHAPWWIQPTKRPLLTYDVNSSYPASMREDLPWEVYGKAKQPSNDFLYDEQFEGIAYAQVSVPEMAIPPLPYRPQEGGVFFPTGEWSAWFPMNELRYAKELGCEVNLLEVMVYTRASPFKEFVNEVYEYKRTATGAARMFAKLMLNGCYGKFGMKPERDILRIFATEEDGLGYAMATGAAKMQSWRVLACKTFKWAPTTHYALASYITAGARIRLHKALMAAEHPSYCDTDSVHCSAYHGRCTDLLGDLKQEGIYRQARYYAPKLYALTEERQEMLLDLNASPIVPVKGAYTTHYVSKGFPVNAESFNRIIAGQEVKTGRMQLARSQLKKGGNAAYVEQLKRWNGRSMKRYAFQSGATRAWTVEEISSGAQLEMKSPLYVAPKREETP